ncbi:MAG TPA: peroxide stress protein YaaA [Candidatus Nanopelagicales bacterium]|nr:peroxide stress protein YaaA [Candidatus Nanopelagicales bacterium]
MLVLLPPSEGKTAPRRGKALDLEALSFPGLTSTREDVLDALVSLASSDPARALEVLKLSPRQTDEITRDAALETAPTATASSIYTGVLYDALDLASLDAAAKRRAQRSVVVASALFGALRLGDRIPAYRLSGDVVLPGLGTIPSVWRDPLAVALPEAAGRGLVVDLRSGTYAAMWRPTGDVASRTVAVRVLQQLPDGSRAVVSHFNKATKGRLLRHWLESAVDPRDADDLADACTSMGVVVELAEKPRAGSARRLDVVVSDL